MTENINQSEVIISGNGKIDSDELATMRAFVWSKHPTTQTPKLIIESKNGSIRLLNDRGKLLAVKKQVNRVQDKILISKRSHYNKTISQVLVGEQFVFSPQSIYPDFDEYHHYQVPQGYQINHTDVLQLWKLWWNKKRKQFNDTHLNLDILIFARNNWYAIQDFRPKQGNFVITTSATEVIIPAEDRVIWLNKIDAVVTTLPAPEAQFIPPIPPATVPVESNIPTDLISIVKDPHPTVSNTVTVTLSNEVDLETYLTTFNTAETEAVDSLEHIYQIDKLVDPQTLAAIEPSLPPTSPPATSPPLKPSSIPIASEQQSPHISIPLPTTSELNSNPLDRDRQRLKTKAITVLSNYLQAGEEIETTEVFKNSSGETISHRKSTVHKDCGYWQIDRALKLVSSGQNKS
jgi:hypothetical protein